MKISEIGGKTMLLGAVYLLILMVFVGAVGGFIFYKLSYKFLLPKKTSYILGGVVSLLLSSQIVMIFMAYELLFGVIISIAVYIVFLAISQKHTE